MYVYMYVCICVCACMYMFVGSSITIFILSNNRFENYMKSKFITTHDSTCNYVVTLKRFVAA